MEKEELPEETTFKTDEEFKEDRKKQFGTLSDQVAPAPRPESDAPYRAARHTPDGEYKTPKK